MYSKKEVIFKYVCEGCHSEYDTQRECLACEETHKDRQEVLKASFPVGCICKLYNAMDTEGGLDDGSPHRYIDLIVKVTGYTKDGMVKLEPEEPCNFSGTWVNLKLGTCDIFMADPDNLSLLRTPEQHAEDMKKVKAFEDKVGLHRNFKRELQFDLEDGTPIINFSLKEEK